MKVAVTGAGGRTGSLVIKRLAESDSFASPKGLVRSTKSADKLRKSLGDLPVELVQGDVSDESALADLCDGCDALVILTSAVPKPRLASIALALVSKLLPFTENRRPQFFFPENGSPELVDWLGQKAQVDAALSGGVRKIVLVSSMGGTQVDNFLNTMGAGGAVGEANILLWKRKAEMYLIEKCAETKRGSETSREASFEEDRAAHERRASASYRRALADFLGLVVSVVGFRARADEPPQLYSFGSSKGPWHRAIIEQSLLLGQVPG